jgi:protein-S-isoprenylcysteine O-methyltransferase Ste14
MPASTVQHFGREELKAVGSLAGSVLAMGALMFLPAGTLYWERGWRFVILFLALTAAAMVYVWRVNPELFAVRRRFQEGSKRWDVIVATLTIVSMAAILPVAGLDDARFHWSEAPESVVWFGSLLFAVAYGWIAWAQAVNRHFELTVRIQTDRGHKVIDTGPYAIMRHPGYVGATGFVVGTALALGSYWALLPAALTTALLIGRTLGEEATLAGELSGYSEYMQRVRYRWVPGVW